VCPTGPPPYESAPRRAQADGMAACAMRWRSRHEAAECRADTELTRQRPDLAQRVTALAHATKGDDYSGRCCLKERRAPRSLPRYWAEILALVRRPVMDPRRNNPIAISELDGRLGARIFAGDPSTCGMTPS